MRFLPICIPLCAVLVLSSNRLARADEVVGPPYAATGQMGAQPPPTGAYVDSRGGDEAASRRSAHVMLRLGAFAPLDGYAPTTTALSGELAVPVELGSHLLLEPRIGVRRSFDDGSSWYLQIPADLGLFVRIVDGDVFPIVGGGIGLRFLAMHREASHTVGSMVWTRHTESSTDSVLGFGAFARVGVGFRLPGAVLLFATADYDLTFGRLRDESTHGAGVFSLGIGL